LPQLVDVTDNEGRMRFLGGAEFLLNADMKLLRAAFEPAATPGPKRLRFFKLSHAEQSAIEIAGGGFAAFGSGDLDVINACDSKLHTQQRIPAHGQLCWWEAQWQYVSFRFARDYVPAKLAVVIATSQNPASSQ
jgi:hypothetical protein